MVRDDIKVFVDGEEVDAEITEFELNQNNTELDQEGVPEGYKEIGFSIKLEPEEEAAERLWNWLIYGDPDPGQDLEVEDINAERFVRVTDEMTFSLPREEELEQSKPEGLDIDKDKILEHSG